jgi:hypothetical protein
MHWNHEAWRPRWLAVSQPARELGDYDWPRPPRAVRTLALTFGALHGRGGAPVPLRPMATWAPGPKSCQLSRRPRSRQWPWSLSSMVRVPTRWYCHPACQPLFRKPS